MERAEVNSLKHGVYRVKWKEQAGGGTSVAAVGSKDNGDRWLCASNWTSPPEQSTDSSSAEIWDAVESMELLAET